MKKSALPTLAIALFLGLALSPARAQQPAAPTPPVRPHAFARQAAEFEAMRLRDEHGVIAPDGLMKAMEQAKQMQYDPTAWPGATKPKSKGPRPMVADLNTNNWEWLGPGNIGGRIRAIAIHPTSPNIMWVGGVTGGIWKSTNSAASFYPVEDWLTSLAITDIQVDPVDPNVLYATTGEDVRGAGIFKSTDGGNTWSRLPSTSYSLQGDTFRMSLCPTNHLVLLVAAGTGIWRSTDGGTNWTQTYTNSSTSRRGRVVFHPTDGSKAVAMGSGTDRGLYSTDGGVTWTAATGLGASGRVELAYAASSPNIVYACQDVNQGTLFASTDGGVTYTQRANATNLLIQGDWDNVVWVDPTNPNVVFVGGVDLHRSTNAGTNFVKVSSWGENQVAQLNDQFSSAHADHHVIIAHPNFDGVNNAMIYEGNDGGLFAITNIYLVNETNSCWTNLNHHLGITQFYGGAGSPTSLAVQGGGQDNGHARGKAGEWADRWHLYKGGDGGYCAVDPTDPRIFYGEYIYLTIARSTDEGQTAQGIYGNLPEAGVPPPWIDDPDLKPDNPDVPAQANFIAPFILDPNNPNTMLGGASNLWRSVNVKASPASSVAWTSIKPGLGIAYDFISAIAVAPGNSDIIWVGYNDGEIFSTANGTAANPTWTQRNSGTPGRQCTRIAIDPVNPHIVYATFGGFNANNVWRTADGGVTWRSISAGLPANPVNTIVIAPWNHNYLYVGSHVGVFASDNAGATWSAANEGPANVRTDELFWLRNYLHAATYGRGMFRIALGPPTVAVTPSPVTTTTGQDVTFTASAIGAPPLSLQWQYDGTNIASATGTTLTVTNLQPENSGRYACIATSAQGFGSGYATLTVIDPPPYQSQSVVAAPVAYYRLNETSGSTAVDLVGGNNGAGNGGLGLGVAGPSAPEWPGLESGNTGYSFSGSGTSVALPALTLSSNITLTAWVKPNADPGYFPGIVAWNNGSGTIIGLTFGNHSPQLTYFRNGFVYSSASLQVPTDQWSFVALVATPTNAMLYLATNSTLISYNTGTVNPALASFTSTAYLGNNPNYGRYSGAMDEVAIYNQALTPTQLTNLVSSAIISLPTITLTSPADGSTLATGSSVNLAATVVTNGHSVVKVQFYGDGNLLNETTTAPFQFTVGSAPQGNHSYLAKVIYDGSSSASSLPANVSVTNLPPSLVNDVATTAAGTQVAIPVLANDTDAYGLPLAILGITDPSRGFAYVSGTNVYYTPNSFTYGLDTFTYSASDNLGPAATASVAVTTTYPNYSSMFTNALLADAPAAWWRLNETNGTTAVDFIGGHNGTINGGVNLGVAGSSALAWPGLEPGNTAYSFSGSSTAVSLPALNLSSNITFTAWVKPNADPGYYPGIISWNNGNGTIISLGFGNHASRLYYMRNGFIYSSSSLQVPTNQWTFVAAVLTPTSVVLYMATNSTLISYDTGTVNPALTSFTNTAYLGNNPNYGRYSGAMDEVAVFNQALTPSQLADLITASQTALPAILLTAPTNGTTFNAASNITLSASVMTNGNHTVEGVQFYNGASLLGTAMVQPFQYAWSGAPTGTNSVTAKLLYDGGSVLTSAAADIIVTNAAPAIGQITSIVPPSDGTVTLNFVGTPSHAYDVQRSTNLLTGFVTIWTTNAPVGGNFNFVDSFSDLGAQPPQAYYRLSWIP